MSLRSVRNLTPTVREMRDRGDVRIGYMEKEEESDYSSIKLRLETHLDNQDPSDRPAQVRVLEEIVF